MKKIKIRKEEICSRPIGGCSENALYGLGVIGAAFYYISESTGFWGTVLAILKSLVWPAFLVYDLLKFIAS